MPQKQFHKHFDTKGSQLYWIIFAYIIIGWFYPVIGLLALICMIGPILTSSDTKVCQNLWVPSVHGVLYLHHVWHSAKSGSLERRRNGYVEWYRSCILDHYCHDNCCGRHPVIYLCSTNMVQFLPYGKHIQLGGTKEGSSAKGVHKCSCVGWMWDEV